MSDTWEPPAFLVVITRVAELHARLARIAAARNLARLAASAQAVQRGGG